MFDLANVFNIEVDCASNGANTLRAVPAGKKLVLSHLFLQAEGAVTWQLKSGSTDITGPIDIGANEEMTFSNGGAPVFKTVASGDDLVLSLSSGVQMNGFATALEVDK